MKLIFENSNGEERVIAEVDDIDEALDEIHKFCDERDFKIYYTRQWRENNRTTFDVGSWSEFFHLED
jgi:hypothetical protein